MKMVRVTKIIENNINYVVWIILRIIKQIYTPLVTLPNVLTILTMKKKSAHKAKLSKADKVKWLTGFGKRMSKKLTTNASHPEKILLEILKKLPYKYEFQKPIICREQFLYIMDFYFPDLNICIEIQSKAWHSTKEQIKQDSIKKRRIQKEGILVIYLWATQLEIITKEEIDQVLKSFVKKGK